MTLIGKNRVPILPTDKDKKRLVALEDENDKLRTQLTYLTNTLHYACKILDDAGHNSPDHKRNMEAIIQGQEPYLGEKDGEPEVVDGNALVEQWDKTGEIPDECR